MKTSLSILSFSLLFFVATLTSCGSEEVCQICVINGTTDYDYVCNTDYADDQEYEAAISAYEAAGNDCN